MLRVPIRLLLNLHQFVLVYLRDSDADSLVCLKNVHIHDWHCAELLACRVLPGLVELRVEGPEELFDVQAPSIVARLFKHGIAFLSVLPLVVLPPFGLELIHKLQARHLALANLSGGSGKVAGILADEFGDLQVAHQGTPLLVLIQNSLAANALLSR